MPTNSHWRHQSNPLKKHHSEKNINEDFFLLFWSKNNHYFLHICPLWVTIHTLFSFMHYLFICFVYEGGQHLKVHPGIFIVFKAVVMLHFQSLNGNACMAQPVFISGWGFCPGWSYIDPCGFHLWKRAEP